MIEVTWQDNGQLLVKTEGVHHEYSEGAANQLILCARMNPWDRFMAMLEKKTDASVWPNLHAYMTSLDKSTAWHAKETFARLQTHDY